MSLRTVVLVVLCSGLMSSAIQGQETIGKPARTFAVTDSKEKLYAAPADDRYVVQAVFCKGDELCEVRVRPKYYFEDTHPEWTEPESPPFMPLATYQDFLRRIEDVKPLGVLYRQGKVGITFNLKTSFWDQYDNGVVERAMIGNSPEEQYAVAWFTVTYFRLISGKLESKETWGPSGYYFAYRVRIEGNWYWTSERTFRQSRVGTSVKVRAAGPVGK